MILLGSDQEFARPIRDRLHGFDAVDHEIKDDLLQLNFVGENDGQRARAFGAQRHPGAQELMLREVHRLAQEVIEIKRRHLHVGLFRERTHAPNDLNRPSAVADDPLEGGVGFVHVGRVAMEPAQAGLGVQHWRVLDYVGENLAADLSLAELAAVAGMSPHYFAELFRQSTGRTPHQYVLLEKIERAKQCLRNPRISIIDAGLDAGFQNPSHFARTFRRLVGTNPSKYKCDMLA